MKTYPLRILEEAEAELFAEYDWYKEQAGPEVANRFREVVRSKIQRISRGPEVYQEFDGVVRRSLLGRFPHGVLFAVLDDEVVIIAIMHLKREPGYWKKRLKAL